MLNATVAGIGQQRKRSRGSRGSIKHDSRRGSRTKSKGNIEFVEDVHYKKKGSIGNNESLIKSFGTSERRESRSMSKGNAFEKVIL